MFIGFDKIFGATLYLRWIPCYLRMAVFEPRDFSRCHLTTRKTPWTGSWFDRGFALFCLRSLEWRKIRFAWEFSIASLKYIEKECRYEREHCFELESNTSCVASNVRLSSDEFMKEWWMWRAHVSDIFLSKLSCFFRKRVDFLCCAKTP